MALAPQIIYTAIDASGERGTTAVNLPDGFTLAQFGEFGAAMATLLDGVLGGKVESAEICFSVDISAFTSNTALSTSDVEEIGAFQFKTSDNLPVNINIPGIDETLVAAASDDIDIADTDIAAFITAMETGFVTTGGTISPCDVAETDIVSLTTARERFRASGKRR